MDLDKLIASLRAAVGGELQMRPLFIAGHYIPEGSDDAAADSNAARRMLVPVIHWLVDTGTVSKNAEPKRAAAFLKIVTTVGVQAEEIIEKDLEDQLLSADVQPEWRAFATQYVAPIEGGLGDDYFKLFVEAPHRNALRDALPTADEYKDMARRIDKRAKLFRRGAPDWCAPIVLAAAPRPTLWQGGDKQAWLRRLETYKNLTRSHPDSHHARLNEYWSLVDAAPAFADDEVAAALIETYLWVDDLSIQESVSRALRQLPSVMVVRGILKHIVQIENSTEYGDLIVDIFPDDLAEPELRRLADEIKLAPLEHQAAYSRSLAHALGSGSQHAAQLLRILSQCNFGGHLAFLQ